MDPLATILYERGTPYEPWPTVAPLGPVTPAPSTGAAPTAPASLIAVVPASPAAVRSSPALPWL